MPGTPEKEERHVKQRRLKNILSHQQANQQEVNPVSRSTPLALMKTS